ncbi:MAG: prepilin-type N-terminal cleavage/methylation domain-containing protein [bacterium]
MSIVYTERHEKIRGFTLVEVLLATVIMMIGIFGAMRIFIPMFKSIEADRERVMMTNIALDRIEEWRSHTYSEIVPGMPFTYFTRAIDSNTGVIAFGQRTIMISSISKINLVPDTQHTEAGYNFNFSLPSGGNMVGGADPGNDVWYDGPDSTFANNTPGEIALTLTCPSGVSGVLTIVVWDYNNQQREERIYINGIAVAGFNNGDGTSSNDFNAPQTIEYTLTQTDTQTGQVFIEIKQTGDSNPPLFGGPNPNAVVSSIDFSILEGFEENDSASPYTVESQIFSTYDLARLVPGWEITVNVSRANAKTPPLSLTTTISK